MEFHLQQQNTLWTSKEDEEEETKTIDFPKRQLSFSQHEPDDNTTPQFSSARPSAASLPDAPWIRSPTRTPIPTTLLPSRPLHVIYHCIASLHRTEGDILSITLIKEFMFVGSESCRIKTWKFPQMECHGNIKASCGQVRALLSCGKVVFSSHEDCRVRMWDVKMDKWGFIKGKKIATLPMKKRLFLVQRLKSDLQHRDVISCLAYNDADKLLYTGSWDSTVKAWDITKNKCVDSFKAHEDHINAIIINQQDSFVFTCSSDSSIKIWRRIFRQSSHILTMILKFHLSPINTIALSYSSSPKTSFLYSGSSNGLINFWEKESSSGSYNHKGFLQGHHFSVLCLVTVKNFIFSGSEDTSIRVWRREEGNCFHSCISVIDGHRAPVRFLAVDLESDEDHMVNVLVCSVSLDQSLKIWKVKVFPAEAKEKAVDGGGFDCSVGQMKEEMKEIVGCEVNPVLSPSWVEKRKLQVF